MRGALTPRTPGNEADIEMTAGAAAAGDAIDYLLCIEGERSWTVPLPTDGALVIGRGDDATLRLADPLVSRSHAQLLVVPDGLRLADLGSRHGTLLNGRRLGAAQLVASGDVITVGSTILVVHRPQRTATSRGLICDAALALRLEEEVERALRYHRELTLVCVRAAAKVDRARVAAALSPRLRLMDSAAVIGDDVVVLLPEIGGDQAGERATALAQTLATVLGPVATAVAVSPGDGCDADTLLSAVRTTAEASAADTIAWVADQVRRIELGEREVVLADPAMVRLYDLVRRLARSDLPILIQGETGVGKELAAAAVHTFSTRSTGPFVSINCAAIPEALAESELFGHERGAFSGAVATKPGRLELGSGGTVFLDELGELPLAVQAKLLRVLESGELMRVGDVKVRTANIRLVAATNRDLAAEVEAGRFRRDLFFRLGAAQIVLPPLRDRPRDLALLARGLADDACARLGRSPVVLSVAATQALFLHRWPGNVRELRNAMDYAAAAMPDTSDELEIWHLPPAVAAAVQAAPTGREETPALALGTAPGAAPVLATGTGESPRFRPIADEVRDLERQRMIAALAATAGVQNRAAELIDMPLRTFVTKLKRYGIVPADWQAAPR